jgi:2,3,4,5-tetrahydropyridine-2-carboxylate N-succinyltransferase
MSKKTSESVSILQETIEDYFERAPTNLPADASDVVKELRQRLSSGEVRAAELGPHGWVVNAWVKKGILVGFRLGQIKEYAVGDPFHFFDKDTFPPRRMEIYDGVRVVPGGSSIRDGAFIGRGVVCMPPMFVNVGAYVGDSSMIDSHALIGSCAQVGQHVHVSAGAQIGGVLEPVGALPVIIEDDVLVGGNCGIYEGAWVRKGAVLASGTILTRSTPVYDLVNEMILKADDQNPLTIPRGAVVVPGSRPAKGDFAASRGVQLYTPVIVKYRDPGTDAAVALEAALR